MRCELATDLPDLEGDEIQAEQVILNLVCNAMEAMSESEQHRREILVRTSLHDGHSVVVDVCDTGPGLSAADAEHVFDAFVSTKEAGMGLGLSISRTIAEAHGGKLWAEPNPDRGVTFRFRLPLPLEVVS